MTRDEIAHLLCCKNSQVKYKLSRFGISKPTDLHVKAIQKSCLEKYGVKNGGWTTEAQNKIQQTNLKRYGHKFSMQSSKVRAKVIKTVKDRYGVDNVFKSEAIKQKIRQTMHAHDSFRQSKEEDYIYETLSKYFKIVHRQYFSEVYPFKCDFYIPNENLYIEYQGFWMHGSHPFDENDTQDLQILEVWKSNQKPTYKAAIKTWTVRDVTKRKIAKQNNLNWLEFFNVKEFENWFETLRPISKS